MTSPRPEVPNLSKVAPPPEATAELPVPPGGAPEAPKVQAEPQARERYWTEDRIVRLTLMVLFAAFAIGLVITLARWDALAKVPFLPWLVGAAIVAGPAWKAYSDYAEEAKGRRTREETRKTGMGINVRNPRDRHQG
jgi:hypothetical protein